MPTLMECYGLSLMVLAILLTVYWMYPRIQAMNALREESRARQRRKAEEGR